MTHRYEDLVRTHLAVMDALLSWDYEKAWSHQRHMLEYDFLPLAIIRCCVQLLGQDGNEWFIPVILQCCRESRLLSYKVLTPSFFSSSYFLAE